MQALLVSIVDDVPDVRSHERLPAREDEDGIGYGGDVVHHGLALVERQLAWIRLAMRSSTTVGARQVAAARDLPGDDARGLDAGALLVGPGGLY